MSQKTPHDPADDDDWGVPANGYLFVRNSFQKPDPLQKPWAKPSMPKSKYYTSYFPTSLDARMWVYEDGNSICFDFDSYEPMVLEDIRFKIPPNHRNYDPLMGWRVSIPYAQTVLEILQRRGFNVDMDDDIKMFMSGRDAYRKTFQTGWITLYYIASSKKGFANATTRQRINADNFGDAWDVVIPEEVLRNWFQGEDVPWESKTRYEVLGVDAKATKEEISKAYREMARLWHPDLNNSPQAKDRFIYLTETKNMLLDEIKRARYDAGLWLQNQTPREESGFNSYAPPKNCGIIKAEIELTVGGKKQITQIFEWNDITNGNNEKLVAKWRNGELELNWIPIHNTGWKKVTK